MKTLITRPAWAEINLDNLSHNIREVRRITSAKTIITAVIKADGYGHGAVEIGTTLLENGADRFAVATLSEAIQLRRKYSDIPILILGYTPPDFAEEVVKWNITQTVYSISDAERYSLAAKKLGRTVCLHVKIDTGMGRLGLNISEESADEIRQIYKLENVDLEGIFTHFAMADEDDKSFTKTQIDRFNRMISMLTERNVEIPVKHVSNSAAVIDLPEMNFNMVRAGIMLYGLYPSNKVKKENIDLREVMSLKVRIAQIKEINEGEGLSYGHKFIAQKKMTVGTLPIGYADGFSRLYSGKAIGIINGKIRPVLGTICMDQCMIDLTDVDADAGDIVTLFGSSGGKTIPIDQYADFIETINYEVVCMISKRVPRVYTKNGSITEVNDWNLEE